MYKKANTWFRPTSQKSGPQNRPKNQFWYFFYFFPIKYISLMSLRRWPRDFKPVASLLLLGLKWTPQNHFNDLHEGFRGPISSLTVHTNWAPTWAHWTPMGPILYYPQSQICICYFHLHTKWGYPHSPPRGSSDPKWLSGVSGGPIRPIGRG